MQDSIDYNYALGDESFPDRVKIKVADNKEDSYVEFLSEDFTISVDAALEFANAVIEHYSEKDWADA